MADGQFSEDPDERIKALNELHAQKVRSLMKSVNNLKAQVAKLNRANKEHKRSSHIKALMTKQRELELLIDVLKQMLTETTGKMKREEIDEMIIKRATGGPKRFRPKIREELEQELAILQRKYKALRAKPRGAGAGAGAGSRRGSRASGAVSESKAAAAAAAAEEAAAARAAAMRAAGSDSKLSDEVDRLTVELEAKRQEVAELTQEANDLHTDNKRLRLTEDKARRVAAKYAALKQTTEELRDENLALATDKERLAEELRALKAEEQFLQEEVERAQGAGAERSRDVTRELKDLQAKYMDACARLDQVNKDKSSSASDAATVAKTMDESRRHYESKVAELTDRARKAEQRASGLERELDDAVEDLERLQMWKEQREKNEDEHGRVEASKEVLSLRAQIESLEESLARERQSAATTAERAQAAQAAMEDAANEAAAEMRRAAEENRASKQQLQKTQQKLKALQFLNRKQLKSHARELESLKAKLAAARGGSGAGGASSGDGGGRESPSSSSARGAKPEQVTRLQEALDRSRLEAAAASTKASLAQRQLRTSKSQVERLQSQVDELRMHLADEVSAHREDLDSAASGGGVPEGRTEQLREQQEQMAEDLRERVESLNGEVRAHQHYAELCKAAAANLHAHALVLQNRLESLGYTAEPFPQDLKHLVTEMSREEGTLGPEDDLTHWGEGQDRMMDGEEEVLAGGEDSDAALSEGEDLGSSRFSHSGAGGGRGGGGGGGEDDDDDAGLSGGDESDLGEDTEDDEEVSFSHSASRASQSGAGVGVGGGVGAGGGGDGDGDESGRVDRERAAKAGAPKRTPGRRGRRTSGGRSLGGSSEHGRTPRSVGDESVRSGRM